MNISFSKSHRLFLLLIGLLLAACSGQTPAASPPAPTPVPSDTPLPVAQVTNPPASAVFDRLPQAVSPTGFPQLGFSNAPVSVTVYVGFGDQASRDFYTDTVLPLADRIRGGEVLLTIVPLAGRGDIANEREAARAALCAGEQDGFWSFTNHLFESAQTDSDPFSQAKLVEAANRLALDLALWDACLTGNHADEILSEADRQVSSNEIFTEIPFVTVNDASSLTDSESLNFTIDLAVRQFNERLQQALVETTPETTDEAVVLPPTMNEQVPPPLIIGLPSGWETGYDNLVLQDVDAIRTIPFAVYQGPITGGTGTIVLLWSFPNLLRTDGLQTTITPEMLREGLWLDGLRLLRLAIVENGCNVGTDLRREYSVGRMAAEGTQFAAVDCPELPDTRGWFAGLRQFNLNFVFYVYTEPIEAMDTAQDELQTILDTVLFSAPPTPDPAATPTAGQ